MDFKELILYLIEEHHLDMELDRKHFKVIINRFHPTNIKVNLHSIIKIPKDIILDIIVSNLSSQTIC